jgi:hypothetical protein
MSPLCSGTKNKWARNKLCLLLASRWFLASLILRIWRWRRHVPPKRRFTFKLTIRRCIPKDRPWGPPSFQLFPEGKATEGEADHSPPSAEVKENVASTPPYVFMEWCLIKHRDSLEPWALLGSLSRGLGSTEALALLLTTRHLHLLAACDVAIFLSQAVHSPQSTLCGDLLPNYRLLLGPFYASFWRENMKIQAHGLQNCLRFQALLLNSPRNGPIVFPFMALLFTFSYSKLIFMNREGLYTSGMWRHIVW